MAVRDDNSALFCSACNSAVSTYFFSSVAALSILHDFNIDQFSSAELLVFIKRTKGFFELNSSSPKVRHRILYCRHIDIN